MRKLYDARDRFEAQLLSDYLNQYHIPAKVFGDYLSGAAGELPANLFPSVWVLEDEDLARAAELLRMFLHESEQVDTNTRWRCGRCGEWIGGEFELCWKCGAARQ